MADASSVARELELYEVLEGFVHAGTVAIGGYAVSARTVPRFSHDLDLVVDGPERDRVRSFMESKRLKLVKGRAALDQNYGGSYERWQRGKRGPTLDLLVDSVQDRDFRVPFPFARVARGAQTLPLRGLRQGNVSIPVASAEVLVALKLQPMRARDMGDIVCLAGAGVNLRILRALVRPLIEQRGPLFVERLARLSSALGPDETAAQGFFGPRIPGPAAVRARFIRTGRALLGALQAWSESPDPGAPSK